MSPRSPREGRGTRRRRGKPFTEVSGARGGDVVVPGPGRRVLVIAPDLVEELVPLNDLAAPGRQQTQDAEFLARHLDRFPGLAGLEALELDEYVVEMKLRGQISRPGQLHTADEGPDPGQQLRHRKRFGHVVVGSLVQAGHPVLLLAARGQHLDGYSDALVAHFPAELIAADRKSVV